MLSNLGVGALIPSGPHDEFLELSAVSTSGQLSQEDQARLQEHLAVCSACRDALREYESIVNEVIPAIAADEASEPGPGPLLVASQSGKGLLRALGARGETRTKMRRREAGQGRRPDAFSPGSSIRP